MPTIHELVDSGAWGEVRKKLKSKGKDELFSSANTDESPGGYGTNTPFHLACSKKNVPQDIIWTILAIDDQNLIVTAYDGGTPLHIACELGSAATVRTLLMFASDDEKTLRDYVNRKDQFSCNALSITWARHFDPDGISYLRYSNGIADTPSEFLHNLKRVKSPNDLEGIIKESWDKTVLILKALSASGTVDDSFANGGQWNVLHSIACAATLNVEFPNIVLWHALKLFPELARWRDGDGNFPLHIVASAPAGSFVDVEATSEEQADMDEEARSIYKQIRENALRMVLNLYPDAAKITNNSGHLPLHMALRHGLTGKRAAMFLKAAPKSVNSRDPVTMLFPFMLAACDLEDEDVDENKEETMLDATYLLLRENPANVQGGIRLTEYEKYLSGKVAEGETRLAEEKRRHAAELKQREKNLLAEIAALESQLRKRKHCND